MATSETEKADLQQKLQEVSSAKATADSKIAEDTKRIQELEARLASQNVELETAQAKSKEVETANADLAKQLHDAKIELGASTKEVSTASAFSFDVVLTLIL